MPEHIVGKTSDIDEGTGKTFTIEGQTIAVFNKSGEIFAIEDTCKHKGAILLGVANRRCRTAENILSRGSPT